MAWKLKQIGCKKHRWQHRGQSAQHHPWKAHAFFLFSGQRQKKTTCYCQKQPTTLKLTVESSPSCGSKKATLKPEKDQIFKQSDLSPKKKQQKFPMKNPSFACVTKVWVTKNSISKQNLGCFGWRKSQPSNGKKNLWTPCQKFLPGFFFAKPSFPKLRKKKNSIWHHNPSDGEKRKKREKTGIFLDAGFVYFPATKALHGQKDSKAKIGQGITP